jgi:hypothetical protein
VSKRYELRIDQPEYAAMLVRARAKGCASVAEYLRTLARRDAEDQVIVDTLAMASPPKVT